MPFIFFMGRMGQKSENGPSRAVYPPGWGVRSHYIMCLDIKSSASEAFELKYDLLLRASAQNKSSIDSAPCSIIICKIIPARPQPGFLGHFGFLWAIFGSGGV